MSIYKYLHSKVLAQITFREAEGAHIRAYLHAVPGADPKTLQAIIDTSMQQGWQVTPYNLGGEPVLEVHGFKSEASFRHFLRDKGWAQGESTHVKSKEEKNRFWDQVRKRSLGVSGLFYVIGDLAFTKYGYSGADKWNTRGGIMYGVGTLSLLWGGRKDQSDLQVREIVKKLDQYLVDNGADLQKTCSLDVLARDHNRGLIRSADDLLRRYPSELMNLFYAAAGLCIGISAGKQLRKPRGDAAIKEAAKKLTEEAHEVAEILEKNWNKKFPGSPLGKVKDPTFIKELEGKIKHNHKWESILDIGLGSVTGLSGLFAMSVKEKKVDLDAEPKHGTGALWQKIQEKPLAIAGVGYMVSTLCHAVSTTLAWQYAGQHKRKTVPWRALFVGANLVAEVLLAISSKGHGEGVKSDKSVDHTVISLAAEAIVKQPAKLQPVLIDHVAGFLGRKDVLAMKDAEARSALMSAVEAMRKNPWALAAGPQAELPAAVPPVAAHAARESAPAAWMAKAVQEKSAAAAAAQPSL